MLWMTHVLLGLVVYGFLVKLGLVNQSTTLILMVSLGSVFPDIDHPKSFISHINFWIRLSSRLIASGGHRGVTHTIWAALLSFPVLLLVLRWLGINGFVMAGMFSLGYISHLIADSFTPSGVAWFFPMDKHRFRGPVKTGSLLEILLFFVLVVVVLYVFGVKP